jgi:hypothetical protein
VQLSPLLCDEPTAAQVPVVTPVGSAGTVHGFGDSTGASVVKLPAEQVRSKKPLVNVQPFVFTYVQLFPLRMDAPSVHPPLVPGGGVTGTVQGSGLHVGCAPVHAAAVQLSTPVPAVRE